MKKDLLALAFAVLFIGILISGTKIQSVEEYYQTHIDDIREDSETVTLTIRCDTILENWEKLTPGLRNGDYVPKDGIILAETRYVLRPEDTVFDILSRAVRANKFQMDFQGADKNAYGSVYIKGIQFIYEFSCGELSGWMYSVNGVFPNVGCDRYRLKDGDSIEFRYTCDLGRDIGGGFQ